MRQERYAWRNKLFLKFLLSYLIMILITLIINFIAWLSFIHETETEVRSSHYNALERVKEITDAKLQELYTVYVQAVMDRNVQAVLQWEGPLQPRHIISLVQIQKKLNNYELAHPIIDHIYLYFRNSDVAISVTGQYSSELLSKDILPQDPELAKDWLQNQHSGFLPYHLSEDRTGVVYVYPISNGVSHSSQGVLVIKINDESINEIMESMKWAPQTQLYLRPSFDAELVSSPGYVVTSVNSGVGDLVYVSLIPKNVFFSKAAQTKIIFSSNLIICLLIGSWIAYWFAKRDYTPVQKLIRSMEQEANENRHKGDNEFDFIQRALSKIIREKDELASEISQQGEILRSHFLQQWVKGRIDPGSIKDIAAVYGLPLDAQDKYRIVIINIHDFDYFLKYEDMERTSQENVALSKFILKNIMDECINEIYPTLLLDSNPYLIGFVKVADSEYSQSKDRLAEAIGTAQEFIEERFKIRFLVSASGSPVPYTKVAKAYQEAEEAMELLALLGNNKLLFYSDLTKYSETDSFSLMQDQSKLLHLIQSNQWESVRELIDSLFVKWFSQDLQSIQMVKSRMFAIIHSLISVIERFQIAYGKDMGEQIRPGDRLFNCQTLQEMQEEIHKIIGELENYHSSRCSAGGGDLHKEVIDYIEDHYTRADLTISSMACHFNISASSLSKQFKKHSGIGPLEYLQFVRIEKAKLLLLESDKNVKDIMLQVGFQDNVSFIRVFKKHVGVTPGVYRKTSDI